MTNSLNTNTLNFDLNTLSRCSNVLRYNVQTYLDLYRLFISYNEPLIIQYYNTEIQQADAFSFDFLNKLRVEIVKIINLVNLNKNSFTRIDDWYLLETLEETKTKLDTIYNSDKWLRSNRTYNNINKNSIQYAQTLGWDDTLEKISQENGSADPQNDWAQIATDNNLSELDYDLRGGQILQLHKTFLSKASIFLNSVIDRGLSGEKLYGLDFNRQITWQNNDLAVLSYNDTLLQSVDILISLKQGDIPEFLKLGIDPTLVAGGNLSALRDFRIIAQLQASFATDDTLRNFKITNISYYNTKLNIEYSVDTMYNLSLNNQQTV